jgi:hypothetical protein
MQSDWDLFATPLVLLTLVAGLLWPAIVPHRWGRGWLGAAAGFCLVTAGIHLNYFHPLQNWDPWHIMRRQAATRASVDFEGQLELVGYSLPPRAQAGETFVATLFWQTSRRLEVDYTAGVFLVSISDNGPTIVAQDDHPPTTWYRLSSQWHPGEIVGDAHSIPVPAQTAGMYAVWVVVYNPVSMQRLGVHPDGATYATLGSIEIEP